MPAAPSPSLAAATEKTIFWWVKIINQVGFPIVVACVLLYFILTGLPTTLASTQHEVAQIRVDLAQHVSQADRNTERVIATNDRLMRVMQQICVNTAQTPTDRDRCFPN